ncbi:MAG TPA: hypothetical protein VKY37_06950 [Brumimicrobium sp.]|nr:hypothetical protein [Brumimicrobium sp.]
MNKSLFYSTVILLLIVGISLTKKSNPSQGSAPDKVSFGVKIGILPTGGLTQYAIVYYKNKHLQSIEEVSLERLIKIGRGEWPVPRTTVFHDYFEEFGMYNDTLEDGTILDYGAAFDSLWKIRFNAHPFDHRLGDGWSLGEIRPSLKQQGYIYDRYGVRGYDQDFFTDSSFFKLLKDVLDPNWIANYKSLY